MHKIISHGDCLENGCYTIHSSFKNALNFTKIDQNTDSIISIVNEGIGSGPYNIVINNNFFHDFSSISFIEIFKNNFNISNGNEIQSFPKNPKHVYNSNINEFINDILEIQLHENLRIFEQELIKTAINKSQLSFLLTTTNYSDIKSDIDKAFYKRFSEGVSLIFSNSTIEGLKMIKGLGIGLTPAGDDFICGLMIGLHIVVYRKRKIKPLINRLLSEIFTNVNSNNLISNSSLYAAYQGKIFSEMNKCIAALTTPNDFSKIRNSVKEMSQIGHSSGIDITIGLLMCLKNWKKIWLLREL